jgi:hypothetical protein
MYMIKKLTFMVAFTAGHAFLTISMISWGCGHRFGSLVLERLYSLVVVILMCPVVLALFSFDPDGDRTPRWFQWSSYFVNGMIWAVVILLLFAAVRRLSRNRGVKSIANNTIKETSS